MKRINNEQILDRIYDLADASGMRIDTFLEKIEEQFGEKLPDLEGLPQEIADELSSARESRKEARKQSRIKKNEQEAAAEIKRFREIFPEVTPEEIPESVWEDVSQGATLSHAFALYLAVEDGLAKYAESVNSRNSKMGAKAASNGSTEPVFTKEQVERMSGKDVKNNYKNILKAMKNWRFN